jgi:hypothetical protein
MKAPVTPPITLAVPYPTTKPVDGKGDSCA